ncbi:hypothetical protein, partial [Rubrivirga sp.]|uniref:hypothetical protein n=1 Tax=Rubrivirga sp. TaxID=1885344 RepID=UPI003C747BED
ADATGRGIEVVDSDFAEATVGVRAAHRLTASGYDLEVALPWSFFNGRSDAPLEGVRLNLAVADRDAPDESPRVFFWRPAWESGDDYPWSGVLEVEEIHR